MIAAAFSRLKIFMKMTGVMMAKLSHDLIVEMILLLETPRDCLLQNFFLRLQVRQPVLIGRDSIV
ncbi:hypothetical protein BTH55_07550 [Lactobacillus delbrueckii subsp. bulgaricus]|nr:hypothetical protein [Lactobacillus delbrueckii subsp. bulgaricus]MBT8854528.1 hypothetical protein [Lactobacillus delbrueckii subsp. bulgaricus]MBT8857615.1 hypothetical protein [Lactobacillus delbrueckii subsp. bulgaricus]MBT8982408.1 hypothetical protein [Lactobacillus delbrueckii subsp. bulgaricus]